MIKRLRTAAVCSPFILASAAALISVPAAAGEWEWDLKENSIEVVAVRQEWTIDDKFVGERLFGDLHYNIISRDAAKFAHSNSQATEMFATVDAELQWGTDEDFEYAKVGATAYSIQWDYSPPDPTGFRVAKDQLETGVIQYGKDDPLGIESYVELTALRIGRTFNYRRTADSKLNYTLGIKASLGWAWADSVEPLYKDVSNPFSGVGLTLAVDHSTWGGPYADGRVVTGFTLGSPATNESISREARVRFGYFKKFQSNFAVDLYLEKRSFNFADPILPDLYTKSKRYGLGLSYKF